AARAPGQPDRGGRRDQPPAGVERGHAADRPRARDPERLAADAGLRSDRPAGPERPPAQDGLAQPVTAETVPSSETAYSSPRASRPKEERFLTLIASARTSAALPPWITRLQIFPLQKSP